MIEEQPMKEQERAELDKWKEAPIEELIRHLLEDYHRETRHGMAELESLAEAAAAQEGHAFPVLLAIRDEVDLFCTEMRGHLRMEEVTLFPAVLAKADGRDVDVKAELMDPLELFADEHDAAAGLMMRIRTLTANFTPPEGAQAKQQALFDACRGLAESLRKHIYLENQILFPRIG
jgi:regulator of cell morphogenesis and NO signaling